MVVEGVSDGDGGPNVGHVVRCPGESTIQEDRNVEVGKGFELLAEEVEGNGQDSTQRETPQEAIVDATGTERLFRTESTPEDGSREKRAGPRAGEVILLHGRADTRDLSHLVVENGRADESGDESCPHLAVEGDPRSDVHVMGELETLSEVESM